MRKALLIVLLGVLGVVGGVEGMKSKKKRRRANRAFDLRRQNSMRRLDKYAEMVAICTDSHKKRIEAMILDRITTLKIVKTVSQVERDKDALANRRFGFSYAKKDMIKKIRHDLREYCLKVGKIYPAKRHAKIKKIFNQFVDTVILYGGEIFEVEDFRLETLFTEKRKQKSLLRRRVQSELGEMILKSRQGEYAGRMWRD